MSEWASPHAEMVLVPKVLVLPGPSRVDAKVEQIAVTAIDQTCETPLALFNAVMIDIVHRGDVRGHHRHDQLGCRRKRIDRLLEQREVRKSGLLPHGAQSVVGVI